MWIRRPMLDFLFHRFGETQVSVRVNLNWVLINFDWGLDVTNQAPGYITVFFPSDVEM